MNLSGIFRKKTTPPAASASDVSRKKILIVDDNEVILSTLSAKLKARGYTPLTAKDGSEAISVTRQAKPDLILLDIGFPPDVSGGSVPWDGFRIIEWLSRMDEAKRIPIIVITGGEDPNYKKRSLDAGAIAFFMKPIEGESLLTVIHQAIGKSAK